MRYSRNLAEYNKAIEDGIIDENVFVIVLEEKVAKFKGETFDWSGGDTDSLEAYMPISRDFSDDFNNDYAR